MTFGEWKEKDRSTELFREPKISFAAWREKEYGGGSDPAPAADTGYSYNADSYDSQMKRLEERKRQAQVDMDMDGVNAADSEMKRLRAQEGKQTIADRVGDIVGASAAGTVGGVANTVSTLWELLGGDADFSFADTAAEDSQRFARSAKAGLGGLGEFAVDTGIAGLNLLGDTAMNTLLPGSGLALTGVRGFGGGAREARQSGASLGEQTAYGLGSAVTSALAERLGNTGLFKNAYGSGWLDDASLSTLGRLALSTVSEGAEEFAEGVVDPLLKRFTYAPDAVYDDQWLYDTLYDSAVGAALGTLGGAADAGMDRESDTQSLAKQENPVPKPETELKPVRVGRVTTIRRPYTGETPVQTQKSSVVPVVSDESVKKARNNIQMAQREERANGGKGFKTFLTKLSQKAFKSASGVPISNMTFAGKPYLVEIGNNVPGKVISDRNLSEEKLAVLDVLPEIVRNAEYVGSGEYVQHSGKVRPVIRYDYFETPVDVDRGSYIAKFDVEVLPGTNNYRTHQIVNMDLIQPEASLVGPAPTASSGRSSP